MSTTRKQALGPPQKYWYEDEPLSMLKLKDWTRLWPRKQALGSD